MHGPWYTLKEAQELLSFNRSELLHQIDTGAIQPVATTKQRSFLVFMRDADKRWLGLGTCRYRGCLTLHPNTVTNLLENEEINLGSGSGRFLEPEKVTNWSAHYPFKQQPPFGVIQKWHGREIVDIDLTRCAATPLPEERQSSEAVASKMITGLSSFIEEMTSSQANSGHKQIPVENPYLSALVAKAKTVPITLDFKMNSLFKLEDLRIPQSEVAKILQTAQRSEARIEPPKLERQRTSQLHELFVRALTDNPAVKSGQLWKLIKADYEEEKPAYDIDGIIERMDSEGINWISRGENEQHCSRRSFPVTLSKLRKELKSDG
tara:strand:+ start:1663 stop:2625 length:963 start_codon:yes stop_codon:yes gene_type:complete